MKSYIQSSRDYYYENELIENDISRWFMSMKM